MHRIAAFVIALFAFGINADAGTLLDAVRAGDLAGAEEAIAKGADVNERSGFQTVLTTAIRAANIEIITLLLNHGADPNLGRGSNVPLLMAASMKNANLVDLLLQKGADPRLASNTLTALHTAAESGCLKCVEQLVAAGADVNALTSEGTPAIHLAKLAGHEDVATFLVAHGYRPTPPPSIALVLKGADATMGKTVFDKTCGGCHRLTGKHTAPPLKGILGRAKASIAGQEYSHALKDAGGVWTYDELNAFIANPRTKIPGTAMIFKGLSDGRQRANVILYLNNQSEAPQPLP